jgi:drug/metabolite transporter (DMT)-like permease
LIQKNGTLPAVKVYLFLAAGLLAASQSGNIIRLGEAHPVAIAAWRLFIAAALLLPLSGGRLRELNKLGGLDRALLVLSGIFLATHFFTWIAAVQTTTVANAAVFFSINPVMAALGGLIFFKERVGWRMGAAIGLGIAGVFVIGLDDFSISREHFQGDLWAVVCAVLFAGYFLIGRRLRRTMDTGVYVASVYAVAALVAFVCLLVLRLPVVGYDGQTWLCFVLMALVPTMIGHTSYNYALKYIPVGWIAAATLSEPVFAGVVAFFAWGEGISWLVALGYLLICLSVVVLTLPRRTARLSRKDSPASRAGSPG